MLFALLMFDVRASPVDSLLMDLKTADKADIPGIYMDLFIQSRHNLDSGLYFANKARESAYEIGDSLNYVRASYAIGFLYKNVGNYDKAIIWYKRTLESARINNYTDREMAALNGLALVYYTMARFDLALRYHFESLSGNEEQEDDLGIAIAANNIGLVYYQLQDYEKALIYLERARKIEEERNLPTVNGIYVNIGLAYFGLSNYTKALEYFELTLEGCDEQCDIITLIEALIGRGNCYVIFENTKIALSDYSKALILARDNDVGAKLSPIYSGMAEVYSGAGQLDLAKTYLDSSQVYAIEYQTPKEIMDNYKLYAELADKNQNYKEAYRYQILYDSIDNQILNDVIAKNLLQIQVDYEERQNLEIIELQNKEIGRRTTLLILAVIISALTAIIVLILYLNNKSRRRVNSKLRDANETIEEQNRELVNLNTQLEHRVKDRTEELRAANAALIKSNHDLDNFIYKTSHDIRGPLATLQGICNIALMDIKDPMSVDYFQKLSKTAQKLNRILSKLLIINQINNSLPSFEEFNFNLLVEEIIEANSISYRGKPIKVMFDADQVLAVKSDFELLKIIVSNIIDNAFKFRRTSSDIESFVRIDVRVENGILFFETVDNGVGIDGKISDQIFDIFTKTSEIQDSAGMGLYLVKLAVDKLQGDISVSKTKENYTAFKVEVPLTV